MKSNTKNAKGSGTIRKRSDGRWEARYTTGIDPKTGKQTQKSVYGKTQKEVRQKLTEVTAEIDSGDRQRDVFGADEGYGGGVAGYLAENLRAVFREKLHL